MRILRGLKRNGKILIKEISKNKIKVINNERK